MRRFLQLTKIGNEVAIAILAKEITCFGVASSDYIKIGAGSFIDTKGERFYVVESYSDICDMINHVSFE